MASAIRSYRPGVRVIVAGNEVVPKHLGDKGRVNVRKSLYAPTGEFRVEFPDIPTAERDSLYGTLPIMAPIEIWMRRWDGVGSVLADWQPVLRGFLRSIDRMEQIGSDGRAYRSVVLVGNDTGSAFLMEQLNALLGYQYVGDGLITPVFRYLQELGLQSIPLNAADFIWELAFSTTKDIMTTAGFEFQRYTTVEKGYVLPSTAISFEGPVWQLLARYSDAPWNELFVREGPDNPQLVFRPTPWRDSHDALLPDADPGPFRPIRQRDILSLNAHRDEVELVNMVTVTSPHSAGAGIAGPFRVNSIVNPDTVTMFGHRLQLIQTSLLPTQESPLNQPKEIYARVSGDIMQWLLDRQSWLVQAGRDTHEFERGSITIKGNPAIQVGEYITVERGPLTWDGYVVGVAQDFQPFNRYLTHIDYIRSNQWTRRQKITHAWDKERATGGLP